MRFQLLIIYNTGKIYNVGKVIYSQYIFNYNLTQGDMGEPLTYLIKNIFSTDWTDWSNIKDRF